MDQDWHYAMCLVTRTTVMHIITPAHHNTPCREHMDQNWQDAMRLVTKTGGCSTTVEWLDDERGDDCLPLPGDNKPDPDAFNCTAPAATAATAAAAPKLKGRKKRGGGAWIV